MLLGEWRITAVIFLVIGVIILVSLKTNGILNNKYNYNCREDKLVKTKKKGFVKYNVYDVQGRSVDYIDKYIISQKGKNKNLICDYVGKYTEISFYILLFNKSKKLIKIMEFIEYNTANCSKAIKLPKKTAFLNIVVSSVNEESKGISLKGEVSLGKLKLFALLESISIFCLLFAFRHLLIEIICFNSLIIFLDSTYNTISIVILVVFALINYFILMHKLKVAFQYKKAKVK